VTKKVVGGVFVRFRTLLTVLQIKYAELGGDEPPWTTTLSKQLGFTGPDGKPTRPGCGNIFSLRVGPDQ
jgi:hypothetical protein